MSPVVPIAGAVILIALLAAGSAGAAPNVPGGMPIPPPPPPPPVKPKPGGGGSGVKPKPPPPAPAPTAPVVDRAAAEESFGNGCTRGAQDGYTDGYSSAPRAPRPIDAPSASVPVAFEAGYNRVYGSAYDAGASDFASGVTPSSVVVRTAGMAAGCGAGFDAWLAIGVITVASANVQVRSLGATRRFATASSPYVSYRSLGRRY